MTRGDKKKDEKGSMIFYRSFYEAIKELPEKNQLEIYNAIFELGFNFKEVKLEGVSKTIFTLIKPIIESNIQRYKNGLERGRKKNQNEIKIEPKDNQNEIKIEPKDNQNEIKMESNKDKDKDKDENKDKELDKNKEENKDKDKKLKIKKENSVDLFFIEDNRYKLLMEKWLSYKKDRQEQYKNHQSIKQCYNLLFKLSKGNPKVANEIINTSMANNWAGLFEIKEKPIYQNNKPRHTNKHPEVDFAERHTKADLTEEQLWNNTKTKVEEEQS
jgi:hypothetical protein